ncbi:MAG: PIG-L family deacetylase [Clostridia bacterium]|nr:PIG-L family deacetylase [Clostridia bacterium]
MNILAVGCHPDDLEIACGGTLAKYIEQGHLVVMCNIANGDKGHAVILPDELKSIRAREAQEAASVLGASELINLDVPDLEVDSRNKEIISKMTNVIRKVNPDIIITHYPKDYMTDHCETSKIVFEASFSASVPHFYTENSSINHIPPIYYMDTLAGIGFLPQEYVSIENYIEKKLKALECHKSQLKWMLEHDGINFADFVATCSKFRGLQCGKAFAEGFIRCDAWPRIPTKRLLP